MIHFASWLLPRVLKVPQSRLETGFPKLADLVRDLLFSVHHPNPNPLPPFPKGGSSPLHLRCSSGSSLRRLGGTVVMRIFTVASAELISKPVSLVSMVSTERWKRKLIHEIMDPVIWERRPLPAGRSVTLREPSLTFRGVLGPERLHHLVPQSSNGFYCRRRQRSV